MRRINVDRGRTFLKYGLVVYLLRFLNHYIYYLFMIIQTPFYKSFNITYELLK